MKEKGRIFQLHRYLFLCGESHPSPSPPPAPSPSPSPSTSIPVTSDPGIQNAKDSEDKREEELQGQVEGGCPAKGLACDLAIWISGMF